MRIAFREKPYDLFAIVGLSLVLVPLAVLGVTGAARIALGLPFILFFPGYALVAALFPKEGEIDWIERIALSVGLSLAVVPLLGLLLNYTPWGIRLEPILGTVLLFTAGMSGIAWWRRDRLPVPERLGLALEIAPPKWREYSAADKALTVALVASIVFAAAAVAYVVATPRPGERFTEFYVLDANGRAEAYPSRLNASEDATVILGVVNHEFEPVEYTIEVRLVTVAFVYNGTTGRNDTVEVANATLDLLPVSLAHEGRWEAPYGFSIPQPGDYKLRFLLYRGPAQGEPYRALHLWIAVA